MDRTVIFRMKRIAVLALCVILLAALLLPMTAFAKEDGNIVWIDLTKDLTSDDGWVPRSLLHKDETHPNAVGYVIWRKALEPYLK